MMQVKEKAGEFSKKDLFNLSKGKNCTMLKDVETGTVFDMSGYVLMTDTTCNVETGEVSEKAILHIRTTDGSIYSTGSPTVIETLLDAVSFMETHEVRFMLIRGKSRSGRVFMDLELLSED